MAAFSRLQLAAALLEYDNDLDNPAAPYRSAHDSAIFAHLRRNKDIRPPAPSRRSADFLGVSLPSETGSIGGRESTLGNRASRGSIDALRNPFGDDEDGEEENEMEVDLTSWGLDAFMPKEKGSRNSRNRAKSDALPNPHPASSLRQSVDDTSEPPQRRPVGTRSMSLGTLESFGAGGAFLEAKSSAHPEDISRRSLGSSLDLSTMQPPNPPFHRRRASSHVLIETLPTAPPLHSIPFPTGSVRSASPALDDEGIFSNKPIRNSVSDSFSRPHGRTYSTASMGSRRLLSEHDENLSSRRDTSPDRASRFDPRTARTRTVSNATMGTMASRLLADDNPFSLRPPSPSRSSRFDPKLAIHARTTSNASLGSRMLMDNDGASAFTGQGQRAGERPLSTMELLRPKILVMPSPLQSAAAPRPPPSAKPREGFQVSTDGPPLPQGIRSEHRASTTLSVIDPNVPSASNMFTPNPRMSLSLSQLTFRNSLMVGGQRDVAYSDIERGLSRATEDGEQVLPPPVIEVDDEEVADAPPVIVEEPTKPGRKPGKLYGKSLIDDLEIRKTEMRSKQRVFKGDERPSMMARSSLKRSSTLIDPESLQQRPPSQRMSSYGSQGSQQVLGRRNSAIKPLLEFEDAPNGASANLSPHAGTPRSRSVFGVDTLWEREMAKLKEIEAQERLEAAEREQQEAEEVARERKRRGKGKGKGKPKRQEDESLSPPRLIIEEPRVSSEPPVLPAISKATVRRPPPPDVGDDTDSDSDGSLVEGPSAQSRSIGTNGADRWFAGASDEEDNGPLRTPGTGPRYPQKTRGRSQPADDDSSEEDMPLAATIPRAAQRATRLGVSVDDSDEEEKPLSALLEKTKLSLPSISFDNLSSPASVAAGGDDDDEPLGLRVSRIAPSSQSFNMHGGDDDDRPLAFHPEQQRRTQYQMMAQQQQMMMHAQMQSSMFFANPAMGSGFFAPPIPAPMMMPPHVPAPISPPASQDTAKYGRVDRWRRDVAVEGD